MENNTKQPANDDKAKILKLIEELDEKDAREVFYSSTLTTLLDLARTEDKSPMNKHVDHLKTLIKDRQNISTLSEALGALKDAVIQTDVKAEKKKTSFFNKIKAKNAAPAQSEQEVLLKIKPAFKDIIENLKLKLDGRALDKLNYFRQNLDEVNAIPDYMEFKKELFEFFNEYIERVSVERQNAANIIKEIAKRILKVESSILDSFDASFDTLDANTQFHSIMEKQLDEMRESVDFSETLEDLKSTISTRIESIESVIESKKANDTDRRENIEAGSRSLKKDLEKMKSEVKAARKRAKVLEKELMVDPLTGAFNRRAYDMKINEEMSRFIRHQRPFSIMIVDLDKFKAINDNYGHAVGDICLKEVVKKVKTKLRTSDFFARFGGEEFAAILAETDAQGAAEVAEKLREVVEQTEFIHKKEKVKVTISIGVTEAGPDDKSIEPLFERADRALYDAKESGRNRVVIK